MNWNVYEDYGDRFDEYVNKGFWRDLGAFMVVLGSLFLAGLVIQLMFVGVVVFFTKDMKPVEKALYVPQTSNLVVGGGDSLCPQSCDTTHAAQPAITSQYLNGAR